MPYKSKWISLSDAIAYVEDREQCDPTAALRQIRTALGDGEIPARWGPDPAPDPIQLGAYATLYFTTSQFADDQVPTDAGFWSGVLIMEGSGKVIDQTDSTLGPRPRELFVERRRVEALWPRATNQDIPTPTLKPAKASKTAPAMRSLNASSKTIREVAHAIYTERTTLPPNVREAEQLIR